MTYILGVLNIGEPFKCTGQGKLTVTLFNQTKTICYTIWLKLQMINSTITKGEFKFGNSLPKIKKDRDKTV